MINRIANSHNTTVGVKAISVLHVAFHHIKRGNCTHTHVQHILKLLGTFWRLMCLAQVKTRLHPSRAPTKVHLILSPRL